MFSGKENFRLLSNIDKSTAVTSEKVEQLTKRLDHKEEEEAKWQGRVEAAMTACPESAHIKMQNGKIDDMTITLKAVKLLTKIILGGGTILAIILGYIQWAGSAEESAPYQYIEQSEQAAKITAVLNAMNSSPAAFECNIVFTCENEDSEYPILIINMTDSCLELDCRECYITMKNIKPHFSKIGSEWKMMFGTEEMYIRNKDGITKYVVTIKDESLREIKEL